jgi:hypothetical protein
MKMSKQYAEIQAEKLRSKDINQSSEGRAHCRNPIGIEIPTGKLQRIQGRIMFIEIVSRSSHRRHNARCRGIYLKAQERQHIRFHKIRACRYPWFSWKPSINPKTNDWICKRQIKGRD